MSYYGEIILMKYRDDLENIDFVTAKKMAKKDFDDLMQMMHFLKINLINNSS